MLKNITQSLVSTYIFINHYIVMKIVFENQICVLITLKEITQQKVMQEIQLVDIVKNMIFKSFTHELKSPLNCKFNFNKYPSIVLMLSYESIHQYMAKSRKNEKAYHSMQKMISTAESCTYVLKNIINDFMDYSVLCSSIKELSLVKKEFSIRSLISRIEHIMIYQLKNPNVVFRVSVDPELPEKMYSDPEKLEQIILNLLLNSQKFTTSGYIKFKVQKYKPKKLDEQKGNVSLQDHFYIRFLVLDTGIGIEKDRISNIFNLFQRNESTSIQEQIKSNNKCMIFQV